MVEFLSEFVMHCLSKDLNQCLSMSNVGDNNITINSERIGTSQAPDTGTGIPNLAFNS